MRQYLLATAAVLGAGATQVHAQPVAAPSQGQLVARYGAGPASNNNNNAWGIANTPSGSAAAGSLSTIFPPNTIAVPTPGTVVIRLNGRVEVDLSANFTSTDVGRNVNGTPNGFKLNPVGISSFMRLYPGFDGAAANGLRYGAAVEIRENFAGGNFNGATNGTTATSPSGNTSNETLFVRRAFTYLASDNAGLLRLGQGDGVVGLFDNCIFTSQCWDAGITGINGFALQAEAPTGATAIPFVWLSGAGAEYGNNKIVYLSPQVYGFDFGVQYAPSMGNAFQNTANAGTNCSQASANCVSLTSGNDSTRWYNQVGAGLRYQQNFGAVDVKAYGFYETAGKENNTVNPTTAAPGTAAFRAAGAGTLRYDNLNFYTGGLAVTFASVTLAVDYIGGAVNGALAMRPTNGASMSAVLPGITYSNGPITVGAQLGIINSQGAAQLTRVSQRHEMEVAFGGTYKVAPGLQIVSEYIYSQRHQGNFDFNQNDVGTTRDAKGQGFMLATVLTW